MTQAVLCYICGSWAFFTTQPLDKQWGDDWNDALYQHNAGWPYEWREGQEPYEITKLAFEGPFETPDDLGMSVSVEDINSGRYAWLTYSRWAACIPGYTGGLSIKAGATPEEFTAFVKGLGGKVYLEA